MMNLNDEPLVVIGSGLAGYTFVRQLREYDKTRPVTLITADGGEVYSKPLLSNALAKQQTPDSMVQKPAELKAAELGIELLARCRAQAVDTGERVVHTDRGAVRYSELILATGAHQRRLVPDGATPGWIDTVNSLDDYRRWYRKLDNATRVLLIGAGLIGCEFADDLMSRGLSVTMVDPAPWPLSRFLPKEAGQALADAFGQHGASLRMGRVVSHLARHPDGGFLAVLDDGSSLHADLVLSAVGLTPETGLADDAGLKTEQGICVDARLQSSDPHVFAMGDCAQTPAGVMPFILPLMAQARVLAQVVAGRDVQLSMKAMPVVVKTTSLPIVVCPPPMGVRGEWRSEGEGRNWIAVHHGVDGSPAGFAVTGDALARKGELVKRMPPLLA